MRLRITFVPWFEVAQAYLAVWLHHRMKTFVRLVACLPVALEVEDLARPFSKCRSRCRGRSVAKAGAFKRRLTPIADIDGVAVVSSSPDHQVPGNSRHAKAGGRPRAILCVHAAAGQEPCAIDEL